jgi:hypothetical protein
VHFRKIYYSIGYGFLQPSNVDRSIAPMASTSTKLRA